MVDQRLYVTEIDFKRIRNLLGSLKSFSERDIENVRKLDEVLSQAKIVNPHDIPGDIVTMNSTVTILDLETGEKMVYTLVYPEKSDYRRGLISIIAPIGSAIFGCKIGNVVEWKIPKGVKKIKIEEIHYQPETAGNFDI
ncbi:MAG: nucleoside diphosphate kinase regulator [Candidatus Latescibacterota bacterium]